MGQVMSYPALVKQGIEAYAALLAKFSTPSYEVVLVFDDENRHYLLRKLGWTKNSRIRQTKLHVAVHDNKIWIEEDMTEEGIATYFLEQGVPHEDIVLGFQPPQMRPYTEFAVA